MQPYQPSETNTLPETLGIVTFDQESAYWRAKYLLSIMPGAREVNQRDIVRWLMTTAVEQFNTYFKILRKPKEDFLPVFSSFQPTSFGNNLQSLFESLPYRARMAMLEANDYVPRINSSQEVASYMCPIEIRDAVQRTLNAAQAAMIPVEDWRRNLVGTDIQPVTYDLPTDVRPKTFLPYAPCSREALTTAETFHFFKNRRLDELIERLSVFTTKHVTSGPSVQESTRAAVGQNMNIVSETSLLISAIASADVKFIDDVTRAVMSNGAIEMSMTLKTRPDASQYLSAICAFFTTPRHIWNTDTQHMIQNTMVHLWALGSAKTRRAYPIVNGNPWPSVPAIPGVCDGDGNFFWCAGDSEVVVPIGDVSQAYLDVAEDQLPSNLYGPDLRYIDFSDIDMSMIPALRRLQQFVELIETYGSGGRNNADTPARLAQVVVKHYERFFNFMATLQAALQIGVLSGYVFHKVTKPTMRVGGVNPSNALSVLKFDRPDKGNAPTIQEMFIRDITVRRDLSFFTTLLKMGMQFYPMGVVPAAGRLGRPADFAFKELMKRRDIMNVIFSLYGSRSYAAELQSDYDDRKNAFVHALMAVPDIDIFEPIQEWQKTLITHRHLFGLVRPVFSRNIRFKNTDGTRRVWHKSVEGDIEDMTISQLSEREQLGNLTKAELDRPKRINALCPVEVLRFKHQPQGVTPSYTIGNDIVFGTVPVQISPDDVRTSVLYEKYSDAILPTQATAAEWPLLEIMQLRDPSLFIELKYHEHFNLISNLVEHARV
jgi:hypothetical protein